jgi:4'-phosphopantetheinyl transferase
MNKGFPLRKLPPEATIEIWLIDLDRKLNFGVNLDNILSTEERDRAGRFIFPRDAGRFRLCRAMLRLGLSAYLQTALQKIELATTPHGKPFLANHSELHFNVTHSNGLGLIAFTTVGEVGIDVEAIQRGVEVLDIAAANFTKNEAAQVAAARTPQEQTSIFLSFWTRKEAVLKAAGCGLRHGLDAVDVSQQPLNQLALSGAPNESAGVCWRVQDLVQIDGFAGAVAAPSGNWSIQQRRVSYEEAANRHLAKYPGSL